MEFRLKPFQSILIRNSRLKALHAYFILFLCFIYFIFWWGYKLDSLPGLHGDEAWSGLKAHRFSQNGVTQIHGMNNYTGILQTLVAQLAFKTFGIGVAQLRLAGVTLNIFALAVLTKHLINHSSYTFSVAFLAIISQSFLYLIFARVAWEVNTFSLLLIILLFVFSSIIYRNRKGANILTVLCFFIVNILGTYNHIIFSSVPIAAFISILLWSLYNRSLLYKNFIILFSINTFNIIAVFLLMAYYNKIIFSHLPLFTLGLASLLLTEVISYSKAIYFPVWNIVKFHIPKLIIELLLIISFIAFICIHGKAFFEVLSGYKILTIVYSYECSPFLKVMLVLCAICFIVYVAKFIKSDLNSKRHSIFAFYIIVYLGLISLYTTGNAYRYYLCLYVIVALYVAFKFSRQANKPVLLLGSMIISFCVINFIQINIFSTENRAVKAIRVKIGRGQTGTSEHFLPKEPILKYLMVNEISHINCLTDNCYFVMRPILFYKLIKPWNETATNTLTISYDFKKYGTGYLIKCTKK